MAVRIAGIDCAVQPTKVGVALALFEGHRCRILEARRCGANDKPAAAVNAWHTEAAISLIAIDAPLGWPVALSTALPMHAAAAPIPTEPNQLFRRETDRDIYRRLGKQPLDVGASFIARTAKAALTLLEDLRLLTGESIPLAWDMSIPMATSVIEVYPAATIRSSALPIVDYKKASQIDGRRRIIEAFPDWFDISAAVDSALESADVLDAILCVLAAVEFSQARAVPPTDQEVARKEGWIWAGSPKDG